MNYRVETLEFDARVAGGELPVNGRRCGVAGLGHVQSTAVHRCEVNLQPVGQPLGLDRRERLVQGGPGVDVELIQHQHDVVGVGVVDGDQLLNAGAKSMRVRRSLTRTSRHPRSGSPTMKTLTIPWRAYTGRGVPGGQESPVAGRGSRPAPGGWARSGR